MTHEDLKTIAAISTPILVILGRLWSMVEHMRTGRAVKKTDKEIAEIKISINGEVDKRLKAERELGRLEGIEESKNKK